MLLGVGGQGAAEMETRTQQSQQHDLFSANVTKVRETPLIDFCFCHYSF